MRTQTTFHRWLVGSFATGFALAGLGWATPAVADELADAGAAVKKAEQEDETANVELNSRAMTHAATREIARSEQRRSEDALEKLLAAKEALKQKIAEKKPEAELAAARTLVEQRLETMRAVVERLVPDSFAHDQAAQELMVAQNMTQQKGIAIRTAERVVLELKAKAAEKSQADGAQRALQELTAAGKALREQKAATGAAERAVAALKVKATEKSKAEAARRAISENQALVAWENQLWAEEQRYRMQQTVEINGGAARIATKLAAAEPDQARKKKLEQFAKTEGERKAAMAKLVAAKKAGFNAGTAKVYPPRAAALGGLTPLSPKDWNYAKARHLLVRAGFGGTPQEVQKLSAMGPYRAVDHLLQFYKQPAANAPLDITQPLLTDPFEKKLRNRFLRGRAAAARQSSESGQASRLRQWWLRRMVQSPRPLEEKLTLFWHGLFAAQYSVVNNSYTMYKQNQIFRQHAAGNYGALLYAIVHDPTMIRYLDNNKNVKGQPNENLAREILELFSMGVDQGYTEEDIIQAARALTGYTYDNTSGGFRFVHANHDTGDKTIFGKTGPWTGDDLVRLILDQPATSRFIARRLFEYFACGDPKQETVERLATMLRTYNYELEPMLRNLFLSQEFYGEHETGCQIKSPIELMVGTLRDLGLKQVTNYGALDGAIQQMGQKLLEPPDVKGWRYGRSWISSNRMFVRYNSVAELINSVPQPNRQGVDAVALLETSGCKTSAELVDYLAKACLMKPLSQDKRKELIGFLGELPQKPDWAKQRNELNEKLQSVLVLMLSMPEYQMA